MATKKKHSPNMQSQLTRAVGGLIRLATFLLAVIVIGCGGGTRGSGGQLYDGFIGDESQRALPNVSVTILGTGDSAVSDQDGRFTIRTESLSGSLTLLVERTDLSTTVETEPIPSDATVIQLTITVGTGAKPSASATIEVRERKTPKPSPSNTPDDSNGRDREDDDSSSDSDSRDDDTESDDDDSNNDSNSGGGSDDSGGSGSGSGGDDSDGDDSSSSDPKDGEKRDVEGSISALDTTQITVSGVIFSVTANSEFRDAKGKDTTLASFSQGSPVRARGVYQGGKLLLTRLELR